MKRVVILGSTGSIGTQTLDVIAQFPDRFKVVGLAARQNEFLLLEQAARFDVRHLALYQGATDPHIRTGMEGLIELATLSEADIVVVSVAGVIGLQPTLAAIEAGKDIALASKEVLVAAGEIVMPAVARNGVSLNPIDSEHSAVFQCVQGSKPDQIDEVILTASGGPFRGWSRPQLESISVQQALNHPTWSMGGKITIDSATLMNKALEMIEARWLFGVKPEQIKAVVHPQSIIHSMVKLTDGSVLAQMGWPNMRLPILYALAYPERLPNDLKPWSPLDSPRLDFEPIDTDVFPGPKMAIEAMQMGGTAPCAFNAANEEAANAFLRGEIPFLAIDETVGTVLALHKTKPVTLEDLLSVDNEAREQTRQLLAQHS